MKNVLLLPPSIFEAATEQAAKQGVTLIELCQRVCPVKLDDVKEQAPVRVDNAHIYRRTGLEA